MCLCVIVCVSVCVCHMSDFDFGFVSAEQQFMCHCALSAHLTALTREQNVKKD